MSSSSGMVPESFLEGALDLVSGSTSVKWDPTDLEHVLLFYTKIQPLLFKTAVMTAGAHEKPQLWCYSSPHSHSLSVGHSQETQVLHSKRHALQFTGVSVNLQYSLSWTIPFIFSHTLYFSLPRCLVVSICPPDTFSGSDTLYWAL